MEVPAPAPPLGLLSLGDCSGAQLSCTCSRMTSCSSTPTASPRHATPSGVFYPLPERVSALAAAATAAAGTARWRPDGTARRGLLDLVRADLLKHVGAPLDDDAALLLVRAPAAWPGRAGHRAAPPG